MCPFNISNSLASSNQSGYNHCHASQPAITCSKLTIETVGQGVKYVQN